MEIVSGKNLGELQPAATRAAELPPSFGVCDEQTSGETAPERRAIRILLLEDSPADAELIIAELRSLGFEFHWERVDNQADYLARLGPGIDLILSDYDLPQFNGRQALHLLKERADLDIPFIIISGTIGEETAVAAIQEGASDYLLKDRIGRLGSAVNRALNDVAERREKKRLQDQFLEAQKMEVIGQLAAGVAHDFNNVLAVIMGYSDLIEQELGGEHTLKRYTDEIRHAARRASGLTRQLLIFSRKETVQAEALDPNDVVTSMDQLLRRLVDENIELTIICGTHLGQIMADSGYIWQVLMNLVVNARDAMPQGGKLAVRTAATTVAPDSPQAKAGLPAGNYVTLSVSDTGVGMTDEVKARLFEAFYTTKPAGKGTGLGLVTCQTIVRQLGGHIEVNSELGQGTTFVVYLPRIGGRGRVAAPSPAQPAPVPRGTETLLIVEDEPSVRLLAQGVLRSLGYDVLIALNGQDALRVVREHQGPRIALVISDVVMPRMGGKAMAEWLRATDPALKVLFTSGYTEEALGSSGGSSEGIDFLPKPYTPLSLAHKVRTMLDQPAAR